MTDMEKAIDTVINAFMMDPLVMVNGLLMSIVIFVPDVLFNIER